MTHSYVSMVLNQSCRTDEGVKESRSCHESCATWLTKCVTCLWHVCFDWCQNTNETLRHKCEFVTPSCLIQDIRHIWISHVVQMKESKSHVCVMNHVQHDSPSVRRRKTRWHVCFDTCQNTNVKKSFSCVDWCQNAHFKKSFSCVDKCLMSKHTLFNMCVLTSVKTFWHVWLCDSFMSHSRHETHMCVMSQTHMCVMSQTHMCVMSQTYTVCTHMCVMSQTYTVCTHMCVMSQTYTVYTHMCVMSQTYMVCTHMSLMSLMS